MRLPQATLQSKHLSIALLLAAAPNALAQHTETVLFGEPNAAGLALAPERHAVHPLTAPYFNEDSFVTTDLRFWYANHSFSGAGGVLGAMLGGNATVYALQIRAALTESLQFVAYKDGFVDFDSDVDALDDDGLNDLAAGIKWAFLQDWETDTHAAVGVGYEAGIGDEEVLQEDDEFRLWASYNQGMDRWHFGANVNARFATGDEDALGDSDMLSWHLHADYYLNESFSPVVELNGYHVLSEGDNNPLGVTGLDVANFGDGDDAISIGLGGEWRPADGWAVRGAWEGPLTSEDDLWGHRLTFSVIFGF